MLVLITLMLITALNLGTTNFRAVTNMQFRARRSRPRTRRSSRSSARPSRRRRPRKRSMSTSTTTPTRTTTVQVAVPECIYASPGVRRGPEQPVAAGEHVGRLHLEHGLGPRRHRPPTRTTSLARMRACARASACCFPKPKKTRCARDTEILQEHFHEKQGSGRSAGRERIAALARRRARRGHRPLRPAVWREHRHPERPDRSRQHGQLEPHGGRPGDRDQRARRARGHARKHTGQRRRQPPSSASAS